MTSDTLGAVIDRLCATIAARKGVDPNSSYTAQLLDKGATHCARKFGEEAVEAIIAATRSKPEELSAEAGDVLYHLLVTLQAAGVSADDVAAALRSREGMSGFDEKAARKG